MLGPIIAQFAKIHVEGTVLLYIKDNVFDFAQVPGPDHVQGKRATSSVSARVRRRGGERGCLTGSNRRLACCRLMPDPGLYVNAHCILGLPAKRRTLAC